jgi:hypothetical protein
MIQNPASLLLIPVAKCHSSDWYFGKPTVDQVIIILRQKKKKKKKFENGNLEILYTCISRDVLRWFKTNSIQNRFIKDPYNQFETNILVSNSIFIANKVILYPTNDFVNKLNDDVLPRLDGEEEVYNTTVSTE